jgi:hypothetical protein
MELAKNKAPKDVSILGKWDFMVRKWYDYFDFYINDTAEGMRRSRKNILTRTRDYIRGRNAIKRKEMYEIRQQLGEISKQEINDVKSSFSPYCAYWFKKGKDEPAKIYALRKNMLFVALACGGWFYYFNKLGVSISWKIASILPLTFYTYYNFRRPPYEDTLNAYRMVLEKRTASARLEEFKPMLSPQIVDVLKKNGKTLYEVESQLWKDIADMN